MTAKKAAKKPAAKRAEPKLANRKATAADVVAAMAKLRERVCEAEEGHDREAARAAGLEAKVAELTRPLPGAVLGSPTVAEAGVVVTRLRERAELAETQLGVLQSHGGALSALADKHIALEQTTQERDEARATATRRSEQLTEANRSLSALVTSLADALGVAVPEGDPVDVLANGVRRLLEAQAATMAELRATTAALGLETQRRVDAERARDAATEAAALRVEALLAGMHAEHLGDEDGRTGPDCCPDACWACALMALPAAARETDDPMFPSAAVKALNTLAWWRYDVDDLIGENVGDVRRVARAALTACGLPIPQEGPDASAHEDDPQEVVRHEDRPRETRAAVEDAQMDRIGRLAQLLASRVEQPLPPALPLRHADAPGTVLGCGPECALDCPECGPGCEDCGPGDAHMEGCRFSPDPDDDGDLDTGEVFRSCPGCSAGSLCDVPGGAKCGACGMFVAGGGAP